MTTAKKKRVVLFYFKRNSSPTKYVRSDTKFMIFELEICGGVIPYLYITSEISGGQIFFNFEL